MIAAKSLVLALMLLSTSTVLAAQKPRMVGDDQLQMQVSYSDLDLTTSAGLKTLNERVRLAIEAVCPSDRGTKGMDALHVQQSCMQAAKTGATEQLDRIITEARLSKLTPSIALR